MKKNYNSSGSPFFGLLEKIEMGVGNKLNFGKQFALLLTFFLTFLTSNAQVTTNGGSGLNANYPDLASAITALNGAVISGPVVITLSGNETAPAGGYLITAEGTSTNTIIIQGTSSIITAPTPQVAGNLNDAIFKLVGADWVTIQGFSMMENAANTVTTAGTNTMTEWGVALLYTTTTNGAQNNTIQNNTIDLNRTYQNTFGIYSNSTHAVGSVTTSATATTATGGNHNLKIYTNTITDVNIGIVVVGPTAAADNNDGLDVGGNSSGTGNSITNYGTTGTFSGYANVSGTVNGILVRNTKNFNVSYNTVTSSNGGTTVGTLRGIFIAPFSNAPTGTIVNTINNNSVSVVSGLATGAVLGILNDGTTVSATTTLSINNNNITGFGHSVVASGNCTLISNAAATLNTNINGNTFTNLNVNTTGNFTFITNNVTHPAGAVTNVNNNAVVTGFTKTGAGGTVYFYDAFGSTTSGSETNSGNNFSNITLTGATTLNGFRSADGGGTYPSKTVTNNTFNNISNGGAITVLNVGYSFASTNNDVSGNVISNVTSGGTLIGIVSAAGTQNFYGNTINGLSTTAAATVSGISLTGGATQNVYKNKIYNLEANNATGAVNGILASSGTTVNIYNNIIGDLRTPSSNAANPLNGINITGGGTANLYYNTVMLNASSTGALFGSSAVSVSTTPTVTLRNNIFVNNSTVMGAGLATAYRRSGTSLTSYGATSNNNLFYGSTFFTDGTNTDATLAAFKTRVSTRDNASVSENPSFVSTAGGNVQFLHINTAVPTLIEGSASPIASYTDDFDGDLRNAATPDIGADEFAGTPIQVVAINSVGITPTGNLCTAATRTVTANVTAGGNDITSVTLNYSFNGAAQTPIAMTGGTLTAGTTSDFSATIPVAVPVNANVAWSVTVADPLVSKNTVGTSYTDEPLFGATASANASVASYCDSGTSVLSATLSKSGTVTIGTGTSLTTDTEELTAFCNRRASYRMQMLFTAAELNASGLSSGPITSLTFNINTLGSSASNTLFTVKMGASGLTALTDYVATGGFTTVFPSANFTHAVGLNAINFSTPYLWDGTSNIIIEVSHNGIDSINNAQTYYTATAGNMVAYGYNGAAVATLSTKRFNVVLSGSTAPVVTNYSWSDGSTVVGTGNNLSVSPTTTTTYTATLTASGCTINTNSVTVTVNTTPAAPTASTTVQPTCTVPTGTIVVTAPLGASLEYSIDGVTYQAGTTFTGVAPGSHNVTVRNTVGGCISLATSVTVNPVPAAPTAPTASTTVQPTCSVTSGTIEVSAPLGATLEYSVDGVTYQASTTFAGLAPNTYNVTVRDTATGCVSSATSVTVNPVPTAPTAPSASATSQPTCSIPVGTIQVMSPVGATLEYSVNGVVYQASTSFSGLAPNTYNVTVRDTTTGCVSSASSVTINPVPAAPTAPTASTTVQPTCAVTTGTIEVSAPLGATLEYSVDGATYQASTTFAGLVSNTYNVTVRDTATGCVSSATSVTVNPVPVAPSAPTTSVTQPTCSVPVGTIQVTAPLGATLEYSIDGVTYQTSPSFSVGSGAYNVTVTDTTTGCVSSAASVTVNPIPAAPATPSVSVTQPTCSVATGTVEVTAPLGATLEYSIDGTTYQSSATFAGLAPNTYTVYVRDTNTGCVSSGASATVDPAPATPGAPTGASTQVISVADPADATIEDLVATGSNIIWYNSDADALAGINPIAAGTQLVDGATYYATQTVGGCTSTSTLAVTVTVTLGMNDFDMASFKIYPNPVTDVLNIEYSLNISTVEVYNALGQQVAVKTVNQTRTNLDMAGLASGTYLVKVTLDNSVKTIKVIKK